MLQKCGIGELAGKNTLRLVWSEIFVLFKGLIWSLNILLRRNVTKILPIIYPIPDSSSGSEASASDSSEDDWSFFFFAEDFFSLSLNFFFDLPFGLKKVIFYKIINLSEILRLLCFFIWFGFFLFLFGWFRFGFHWWWFRFRFFWWF